MVWIQIDESKCDGCGECMDICPSAVFDIVDEKCVATNIDECVECCSCVEICQSDAIEVDAC